MTHRTRITIAALVLVVFGAFIAGVCVHRDTAPESAGIPPVLMHDERGLRLTFHVYTRDYGLFDRAADPNMLKNLRESRPEDFRRLQEEFRTSVKSQYGRDPEELAGSPEVLERLRGHPYF